MRTVTLGSLGAVAPIIPAASPHRVGIGASEPVMIAPNKTLAIGGALGLVVGLTLGHIIWKRR